MKADAPAKAKPPTNLWEFVRPGRLPEEARQEVVDGIIEGAFATRRFYVLLALSTTLASLGLLANSAAVIIGAMIIAPLMGPILGLALGMVSANHIVERRSLLAEVTGVVLSIGIGYVVGLFPIHMAPGGEMLARTSPTIYDLGIALASGLAGGYASVDRKVNSTLAGVAISVALVPPLATCGLFLSIGDWKHSLGAFLLFVANFFCIQTAAALVFWLFRLHRERDALRNGVWRYRLKFVPSIVAVIAMSWFMTGTLVRLVRDQSFETKFRTLLNEQISKRTGGRLDAILDRQSTGEGYRIVASALTPKAFDASQVAQIESVLRDQLGSNLTLILRSVISQDVDHSGRVFFNEQERAEARRSEVAARYLDQARGVLARHLQKIPGASLDTLERSQQGDELLLVASINAPQPMTSVQIRVIQEDLADSLEAPVRLVVRSTTTTVIDRDGILYAPKSKADPPEIAAIRVRAEELLRSRMRLKPARDLQEVTVAEQPDGLHIEARVVATQPVRPEEVQSIQAALRSQLHPRILLRIKTTLSAEADAQGWKLPG